MNVETAYRRRWATLGVLCLSLLVIGLDNTILNVALPSLSKDLHAGESQLQWVVDGYTLVFAGLLLAAGSLGDRFGRKRALAFGLIVFCGSSIWAATSSSATELTLARALMGVGGAFIMPSTLSVLTNSFRDPQERAKAIGLWAAVSGLGIVFGPVLGGWLLGHFWWGSVFLVNVPVTIAALVAGHWLVPESKDPAAPRVDVVGAILSFTGLASLVWGIIEAPSHGWTSTAVLVAFTLGGAALTVFGWWESQTRQPMLDMAFFRDPRISAAALSTTLVFFALFGTIFFLTQYLQFVLGYSPLEAGVRVMPIATMVVGAPLAMKLSQHMGVKAVVAGGLSIVTMAMLMFSTTTMSSGYGHVVLVLSLLGFGMGATMAPATNAVMAALPKEKAGVGSAINDSVRQVGGALGVAVLGSILSSVYVDRLGQLPPAGRVPSAAKDGIGPALTVATHLPAAVGATLAQAARAAFVHAMDTTVLVGSGFTVLAVVAAAIWMPTRVDDIDAPDRVVEPEFEVGELEVAGA
ncbi:MAG TPA: MFS transporter [Actinomycetes bacterium]|nr:MFS transporter [Actinomycetes bacterium]